MPFSFTYSFLVDRPAPHFGTFWCSTHFPREEAPSAPFADFAVGADVHDRLQLADWLKRLCPRVSPSGDSQVRYCWHACPCRRNTPRPPDLQRAVVGEQVRPASFPPIALVDIEAVDALGKGFLGDGRSSVFERPSTPLSRSCVTAGAPPRPGIGSRRRFSGAAFVSPAGDRGFLKWYGRKRRRFRGTLPTFPVGWRIRRNLLAALSARVTNPSAQPLSYVQKERRIQSDPSCTSQHRRSLSPFRFRRRLSAPTQPMRFERAELGERTNCEPRARLARSGRRTWIQPAGI